MAYRLLAIDLDGTLLTRTKCVSPRTRRALNAAAGLGCRVVIATGRSFAVARFGHALYVTQTSSQLLELLHPEVSKGAALRRIAHMLGVARDEVIAFGDSHNDLDMLEFAGVGVAMGNASAEVKALADLITDSNEDDGIATALERLGVI